MTYPPRSNNRLIIGLILGVLLVMCCGCGVFVAADPYDAARMTRTLVDLF